MAEKKRQKKAPKKVVKKVVKKPKKKLEKTNFVTKVLEHKGAIIISIAILVILAFGVWWVANAKFNSTKKMVSDPNLDKMLEVGRKHFKGDNLPAEIHETKKLTLKEMLDKDMLTLKGNVSKRCDLEGSYVQVTKTMDSNYSLAARINCRETIKKQDEAIIAGEKKQINKDRDCKQNKCN